MKDHLQYLELTSKSVLAPLCYKITRVHEPPVNQLEPYHITYPFNPGQDVEAQDAGDPKAGIRKKWKEIRIETSISVETCGSLIAGLSR